MLSILFVLTVSVPVISNVELICAVAVEFVPLCVNGRSAVNSLNNTFPVPAGSKSRSEFELVVVTLLPSILISSVVNFSAYAVCHILLLEPKLKDA